jgi:hypothetical protein
MPINQSVLEAVIGSEPRPPDPEIRCGGCRKRPHEIPEYVEAAQMQTDAMSMSTPEELDEYVRLEEGTFNEKTNRFLCDACYVAAGQPARPYGDGTPGWTCP